jgi:tagatose 6-phosphate kinase
MTTAILTLGTTPAWQRTMVFDRLTLDAVNRSTEVFDYASGKSINAARVLRTIGANVVTTGFAGGPRGEAMCRDLDQIGIAHDFQRVAAPTRQCITIVDRTDHTATELIEESLSVAPDDWSALDRKVRDLLPRCKCWILTGSLPPGAPSDFYARFLPLAPALGARAIVDARGESLRQSLKHGGFIVKLNRDELAATLETELNSESDLRSALVRAVPPGGGAIVTLGRDGSIASDGRSIWTISTPKVEAVSAIGSGDAYAAGLADGLSRGLPLPQACALGAACGAANALTPLAGHVTTIDVERLRAMIKIKEIVKLP